MLTPSDPTRTALERLREAIEVFVCEYRARYAKPSTAGIRSNAPMREEVAALNSARIAAKSSSPNGAGETSPSSHRNARAAEPVTGETPVGSAAHPAPDEDGEPVFTAENVLEAYTDGLRIGRRAPSYGVGWRELGPRTISDIEGLMDEFGTPNVRLRPGGIVEVRCPDWDKSCPSIEAGELETAHRSLSQELPMPKYHFQQDDLSGGVVSAPEPVWADLDGLRERIAEIISPSAFAVSKSRTDGSPTGGLKHLKRGHNRDRARTKANLILAELRRLRQRQGEE